MKHRKKSLSSIYAIVTVCLVLVQSLLVLGMLIAGGILNQARENVYQSFESTVTLRAASLQDRIDNRWTNIDPYIQSLSDKISEEVYDRTEENTERFLADAADTLISMLKVSGTTGVFIILDGPEQNNSLPTLYIRDYDPETNSADNSDLYQILGPPEISKKYQIPLDSVWSYGLTLNEENDKFYKMPYQAASQSLDYKKLGYWSEPFSVIPGDVPVITYTVPLFDRGGRVHGVVGVEISEEYLKKLLPATELSPQDSPGYMIALRPEEADILKPLIKKGEYQKRLFGGLEQITTRLVDGNYSVYQVMGGEERIYACVKKLDLYYNKNVPYDNRTWVLVGLMKESALFAFFNRIIKIFAFTLPASLGLGAVGAWFISRKITNPVTLLAAQVRKFDYTRKIRLERTGIEELDLISQAVEISNQNLLESTLKMSGVMDMLGIPIGAFEYKMDGSEVQVTKQVFSLMNLPVDDRERLYVDKTLFLERLAQIQACPAADETDVYIIGELQKSWVRITLSHFQDHSLGIIQDVTEDMEKKQKIQYERDHDSLTRLYNRAAFQRAVEARLHQPFIRTAAMVMMDLDGLKGINDRYGHEGGDIYIRETAARLKMIPKEHAIVGRRSGDEFFMFLYGYGGKDAIRRQMADFYKILEENPVLLPCNVLRQIRISSGLSWYREGESTFEELVRQADEAMYQAKNAGKGYVMEYKQDSQNNRPGMEH